MKWRRFILLLLWILSLVGITFYGGAISYGLFWGITLIPVLSLVYLLFVFMQFRIYQEIGSRIIVCKQPVSYFFILQNETVYAFAGLSVRLFSDFSYVTDMPENEEYELLPGDKYTFHTTLICKYRGEYEVGVKDIIITDFFRLFRIRYKNPGAVKALVYPRIVRKKELESIKDIIHISTRETLLNQTVPDVVTRDYVAGDALKRIHWKVSAREQKLKTRTMLGERKQEILLLYDTKRYSEKEQEYIPAENQVLELVIALGLFFAEKNIMYTVVHGQDGMRTQLVEGLGHFEQLYEETAHVIFDVRENITSLVKNMFEARTQWNTETLIVVVQEAEIELMRLLQILAQEGYTVILYVVTDKDISEYVRQSNSRMMIIAIPVEGNLEEIL